MITLVISTSLAILLAGLASVAVQGGGIIANAVSNRKTNKRNEELTREQNEWNRQQILDERAYNNPQLAIQRLKDAGLNPNLAYGDVNSQVDGSAVGNAPTMQALDTSPFASNFTSTADSVMQAVNNKRMLDIEQQNADSRSKEVGSVVKYNDAAIVNLGSQTNLNNEKIAEVKANVDRIGKAIEEMNARIKVLQSQSSLMDEQKRLTAAQAFVTEMQGKYGDQYWQSFISNLDASSKHLLSQARLNARQFSEMCASFETRLAEMLWNIELKKSDYKLKTQESMLFADKLFGLKLNNLGLQLDFSKKQLDYWSASSSYQRQHLSQKNNNWIYNEFNPIGFTLRFTNQVIGDLGAGISFFGPKL